MVEESHNTDDPSGANGRYVTVLDSDVRVVECHGNRVVTFRQVDELHGKAEGQTRKQFNEHRGRFVEGRDYFVGNLSEFRTAFSDVAPARGGGAVMLLTERGYGKVVKAWNDDRSWQLFDAMQDAYFLVNGEEALVSDEALRGAVTNDSIDGVMKRVMGRHHREVVIPTTRQMVSEEVDPLKRRLEDMEHRVKCAEEVSRLVVDQINGINQAGRITALQIVENMYGLKKGQRPKGLVQFVTARMRKFCEEHEAWKEWRPDGDGVYLFPIAAAKKWLQDGGLQMIAQKAAEGMARKGKAHQGVLHLVRQYESAPSRRRRRWPAHAYPCRRRSWPARRSGYFRSRHARRQCLQCACLAQLRDHFSGCSSDIYGLCPTPSAGCEARRRWPQPTGR